MPTRTLPELKSANQAAFDHYLRSGERLTSEEWLGRQEAKFGRGNPYHDKVGRFTSASGAVSPRGEAGFTRAGDKVQEWFGNSPKKPALARPKPTPAAQASRSPPKIERRMRSLKANEISVHWQRSTKLGNCRVLGPSPTAEEIPAAYPMAPFR